MALDIVTIPCLKDNYAYLVKGAGGVCLIDAPEAGPVRAALKARGWRLDTLLITHHHHDHVGGVAELRAEYGCAVMGPKAEADKLPPLDRALEEGDLVGEDEMQARVIAVPGHTLGHVAFHFAAGPAVFTADSLMAVGCGRVFEGTPEMMWESLSKLAALPPETMVYSGHDYTLANAKFARTIEPENAELVARIDRTVSMRVQKQPTAQAPLSEELATNPFLRADRPHIKRALGMADAPDAEVFAEIRARKDRF
ncbi:hydroxyacylglutathione hydrolase [Defluviimonas sp. 20V17]|uniref:Hydroxyacylglutathione hydrolase n=1 Tax=Allgaiera indica TaxID=765699 RepID=A0AAN4UPB2_9RHOB|nr:hydroxyacylglutathione hydrolase [Allgaiera indica]KDB03774.1 hydroxyacylglutathione hydrolase [Defluviimonas sp. 20V17]GHD99961.1 hydroxyacylglutathione hydrolase [Allgaiera indica]SDW39812.1 hydroxyacylglutathione hydrolase [Allgaiera indica]